MLAAAACFAIILILYIFRQKNLNLEREKARELERFISYVCKANDKVIEVESGGKRCWYYQVDDGRVRSREKILDEGNLEINGLHPEDREGVDKLVQKESMGRMAENGDEVYFECPAWFGGAFYIFLMRQFLRGIPRDFEESAIIDGANYRQIFTRIFLPLMKPQLALSAIMYMIVVWNDYLGPLVYISDSEKFTLPIGLSLFKGAYTTDYTSIMAITVLMTLPTMIAFFLGQKQILNSNVSAGIKG